MINRLMNRLNRVFNKEPIAYVPMIISSTTSGAFSVTYDSITIANQIGQYTILFEEKTLNDIAIEIDAISGLSAVIQQPTYSYLKAKGLLPIHLQDLEDGRMYMASSIFYNEMQVYADNFQQQANRLANAEQQLYMHSATDVWLDYWARDYFGNPRKTGETDVQYTDRVVAEIIRLTQNNKAMEIALKNAVAVVDCIVRDADITNGMSLQYDGAALYVGNDKYAYRYGSQPGCFYITTDIPTEDARTLDEITKTLVSTANKIKAAGTKLDGVVYKTSSSDTATISETATLTAKDAQPDILPWGLRYDGSVNHNSGRNLFFDGSDTYNGAVTYNLAVDGDITYSNAWETQQAVIHATVTDQQQVSMQYNGLANYDGVFDQGATPPPLYDTRMTITARRHNLYSGQRTYGADKRHDGSILADGTADYSQMRYEGIHTIQEITI